MFVPPDTLRMAARDISGSRRTQQQTCVERSRTTARTVRARRSSTGARSNASASIPNHVRTRPAPRGRTSRTTSTWTPRRSTSSRRSGRTWWSSHLTFEYLPRTAANLALTDIRHNTRTRLDRRPKGGNEMPHESNSYVVPVGLVATVGLLLVLAVQVGLSAAATDASEQGAKPSRQGGHRMRGRVRDSPHAHLVDAAPSPERSPTAGRSRTMTFSVTTLTVGRSTVRRALSSSASTASGADTGRSSRERRRTPVFVGEVGRLRRDRAPSHSAAPSPSR